MSAAVILAAGAVPSPEWIAGLPPNARIVIADGGLAAARAFGLQPDDVVGDFDSCRPEDLTWAEGAGAAIHRHRPDKDATDLELALDLVADRSDHITVLGIDGGRTDHVLGNWAAVANPELAARVEVLTTGGIVHVVHDRIELSEAPEERLSLLAWGGVARGVTTIGLRWELDKFDLSPYSARGVSNEFVGTTVSILLEEGVLFVVLPSGV